MGVRAAVEVVQLATRAAGLGQRTDAQLLADVRADRDPAAFEALVRRHGPLVLSACRTILKDESAAEDAFQAAFVALYQSAPAIRGPSAAGWLFRVARRAALRAKRAADRRTRHERSFVRPTSESTDPSWREAVAALHEELDRLPETDRQPLILCYLEGLSRDEAARRLGWTLNEVRGRLERARGRLRKRLERRGITLSAGLLAAVGIEALHPTLVRAAVAGAAHPTGRVAELAAVAAIGKARVALALVVAAGLVAATGLGPAGPRAGAGATDPPAKEAPKVVDAPKDERAIRGRVVDPDGRPVAGAVVWRLSFREPAREVAQSDADGRFAVAADPQTDLTRTHGGGRVHLAATKDGFGMALPPERFNAAELVLKLVKDDVPVRGRILDLQGQPVAGVTVAPLEVWATPDESLADWLKALPTDDAPRQLTGNRFRRKADPPPGFVPVKTDEKGRFAFAGVGRERLLRLRVSGPTVATAETDAVTRDLPAVRVQYDRGNPKLGQVTYHGAAFDFAADPTQPFEGIVRDQESGKPIAGALVRCDYPYRIETTADADGHYRLLGLPPGEHRLVASPPAGVACLPLLQRAGRANNEKSVGLDFALARGAWVEGTVTDARTKKPIARASLSYCPLDEKVVKLAGADTLAFDEVVGRTDRDGKFKFPAAPGPGAVGIHGPAGPYVMADRRPLQGDALLWTRDGVKSRWTRTYFAAFDALAVVEVDPRKPRAYAFTLDAGEMVAGRVLDPDGKPLAGCRASLLTEYQGWTVDPLPTERFEVRQVTESRPRAVLFWHEGRKLGGVVRPTVGDAALDVRLAPTGSATGRLLDPDGTPAAGRVLEVHFLLSNEPALCRWFPQPNVKTDAAGRFELPNLPAGPEFNLRYSLKGGTPPNRYSRDFRVESGRAKDLGDLTGK